MSVTAERTRTLTGRPAPRGRSVGCASEAESGVAPDLGARSACGAVDWDVGPADAIPAGEGREVRIAGTRIAVFRTRAGDVYATQAVCPHRGGPLADGLIGGGVLACPLHEFRFELSTGAPLSDGCESLRTYPVRLDPRGHVVISIAEWGRSEDV